MKNQRAVSFDESSMESCGFTTTTTTSTRQDKHNQQCDSGNSSSRECWESRDQQQQRQQHEVTSLEEAKNVIAALKARQRSQAYQMLAWRRTLKLQEELVARLTREKAEQLRSLSSQLLLFESRLCRKQKEIEASLAQREAIILRQQKVIKQLQQKLKLVGGGNVMRTPTSHGNLGSMHSTPIARDSPPCDELDRLDSLGDGDSAVVLEEAFLDDPTPPRFRSNLTDVTVIRSVSDAVEPANKYCAASRRCNGFLRRPEILETVYSVEEDVDADSGRANDEADEKDKSEEQPSGGEASSRKCRSQQQQQRQQQYASSGGSGHSSRSNSSSTSKPKLKDLYGSFERLAQHETEESERTITGLTNGDKGAAQRTRDDSQQAQQVTYNRVMSNHRSVTKPKDVKYKRINKAKSKSLEELRGRLKNWVEKGSKIAISLDQSYA